MESRQSRGTFRGSLDLAIPDFHSATTAMHPPRNIFAAIAASTATLTATLVTKKKIQQPCRKYNPQKPPKYKRSDLLRPQHVSTDLQTPCNVMLSSRRDDGFLVTLNITKTLLHNTLFLFFNRKRKSCNYGSLYGKGPKTRGRNPQLRSVDFFAMLLWYVKIKGTLFILCSVFGIVPISIEVRINNAREVLLHVVKCNEKK